MRHDVRMGEKRPQTDQIRAAGVKRLRGTATALALAAFALSLGCQVTERRDDGDRRKSWRFRGLLGRGCIRVLPSSPPCASKYR